MPIYNKLVRDRITQVLEAKSLAYRTRILNEDEYQKELVVKLKEESTEYFAAQNPKDSLEELADMLEVIRALATVHGASWEELEEIRNRKAKERGGFQERVYLIDVDDA